MACSNSTRRGVLATAAMAVAAVVGGPAVAGSEATLRFASTLPLTHHVAQAGEMFAELVGEKTEGRVTIEHYPSGQLFAANDMRGAVATGALDMGMALNGLWSSAAIGEIADIPFFLGGYDHANEAFARGGAIYEAYDEALGRTGMKPLLFTNFGSFFDVINNGRQLVEPGDFAGMQLRSPGAMGAQTLEALGASPVVMSPGEMYMGLQRGTIDGASTGVSSFQHRNLWEVGEFATVTGATMGILAVVVNRAAFERLSEESQAAILEAAAEVQDWSFARSEEEDMASLDFLREQGTSVHILTDEERDALRAALDPVIEDWRSRATEAEIAAYEWADSLR